VHESQPGVAALLVEPIRRAFVVVLERVEQERATEVAVLIVPPAAPIRNVHAALHQMPARRPRQRLVQREMPFGLDRVALRPAAGEHVGHDNPWRLTQAHG
jgi:hypothetical protein